LMKQEASMSESTSTVVAKCCTRSDKGERGCRLCRRPRSISSV
jgi:hypothetical protein